MGLCVSRQEHINKKRGEKNTKNMVDIITTIKQRVLSGGTYEVTGSNGHLWSMDFKYHDIGYENINIILRTLFDDDIIFKTTMSETHSTGDGIVSVWVTTKYSFYKNK